MIGGAIIRERDGLAMSSRNVYLSADERRAAPVLFRTLKAVAKRLRAGDHFKAALSDGAASARPASRSIISKPGMPKRSRPCHRSTMGPVRLLVAGKIGTTRLIDNIKA